ncbi:hypothetical protein [Olsenella porci]|uniref:hypothetical protein n=1 Tax=Olsenella porci TaxID=2652279 RepID=UPI0018A6AE98|nr:hypothetical protein [Olsenella porci]
MEGERDGRVVVTLHENFVREHIRYTDRRTGEEREFNQARVPSGTVVGGDGLRRLGVHAAVGGAVGPAR